jgi:hypothetical protein
MNKAAEIIVLDCSKCFCDGKPNTALAREADALQGWKAPALTTPGPSFASAAAIG